MALDQTTIDNAEADALALASFMNDAAGTVTTRLGGSYPNLASLIATVLAAGSGGTEVLKTTSGDVTVTTERKVLVKKTVAQATTITLPLASTRNGTPITVGNLGTNDYVTFPTTVQLSGTNKFDDGTSTSFVMDSTDQVVTFWPMPDNSGYYKG